MVITTTSTPSPDRFLRISAKPNRRSRKSDGTLWWKAGVFRLQAEGVREGDAEAHRDVTGSQRSRSPAQAVHITGAREP